MEEGKNQLKVKYHNDLSCIKTTSLKETDLNVFFALCAKAKDENSTEITISFESFIKAAGLTDKATVNTRKKMISFIDKRYDVLKELEYKSKTDKSLMRFTLINKLFVNEDDDFITLRIDEDFLYILNTETDFTKFVLANFVGLNGKYAKNLYRLLMRYDGTGWADYAIDDFKNYMGVPDGYRSKDILNKVINPAIEEIRTKNLMQDIRCEMKTSGRQGRAIKGFHFEFKVCVNDGMPGQLNIFEGDKELRIYNTQKNLERKNAFLNYPQREFDSDLESKLLDN
ncbi:MAG: replication initiation protein [Clostridiales bacterium]|nr:replication initiation protein [Clostridiales bacterium]